MNWDLSKLPDDVLIQIRKGDLIAFADRLLTRVNYVSPPRIEDEILDFNGMCDFLKISRSKGYQLTSAQELPLFKRGNGRKLWFRKSELIKWLEEGRRRTRKDIDELAEHYLKNSKRK